MTRIIQARRDPKTGEHFHSCPRTQGNAFIDDCKTCVTPAVLLGGVIELLPASYRIHCPYGEAVKAITPSHVDDSIPASWGTDKFSLESHTIIEPKLDGARAILLFTETGVRVFSRRNNRFGDQSEFTENVPHIASIRVPQLAGTILDGEIICVKGKQSVTGNMPAGTLGATMAVVASKPDVAIATQEKAGRANVYVFDMPKYRGEAITETAWQFRHDLLTVTFNSFFAAVECIHLMPWRVCSVPELKRGCYQSYREEGAEGCVLKNPNATYYDLHATLKVKETVTLDAVVTGYELGKPGTKYAKQIGTLLMSVRDAATGELVEVAKVTPGDNATRERLTKQLVGKTPDQIRAAGVIVWLQAQSWTKEARLRHARILEYCQDRDVPSTIDFSQIVRK